MKDIGLRTILKHGYFNSNWVQAQQQQSYQVTEVAAAAACGNLDEREWQILFTVVDPDLILDAAIAIAAASNDYDDVTVASDVCRRVGQLLPADGGVTALSARTVRVFQLLESRPHCEALQMCALNLMDKLFSEDGVEVSHAKEMFLLVLTLPQCDNKSTMLLQIQKFLTSKKE